MPRTELSWKVTLVKLKCSVISDEAQYEASFVGIIAILPISLESGDYIHHHNNKPPPNHNVFYFNPLKRYLLLYSSQDEQAGRMQENGTTFTENLLLEMSTL